MVYFQKRMRLSSNSIISAATLLLVLLLTLETGALDSAPADWSYEGATGPDHWQFSCQGKSQSPIDLDSKKSKATHDTPFKFVNYGHIPESSELANVGTTVKYSQKDNKNSPSISAGGLQGTFEFAQLHLHWGENDQTGSEHTINQKSYAAELHLVHFNKKYGDDLVNALAKANGSQDALAVLGVMLVVTQGKTNDKLDPIIKAVENITSKSSKSPTKPFALKDLLPVELNSFFRYNGSLTTPGCEEIVIWTVFKNPIQISDGQLGKLRSLASKNPNMKRNFRPVQNLNGRTVLDMDTSAATAAAGSYMLLMSMIYQYWSS